MNKRHFQQWLGKLKGMEPKVLFSLLGVGAAVLIALDVLLITLPQINAIAHLTKKSAEAGAEIDALAANSQRMSQFQANLEQARGRMKEFKALVHKTDEVSSVLKAISTIANQFGVKIDQLVPQPSDGVVLVKNEDGKYGSLSVLVKARAGYHDLARFLERLEKESVLWQVAAINIIADPAATAWHTVRIEMKVLTLGEK